MTIVPLTRRQRLSQNSLECNISGWIRIAVRPALEMRGLSVQRKYIALLDDDDEFLTHKLMVQVPILEAHPEIGVLYGQKRGDGGETPLLLWPEWGRQATYLRSLSRQPTIFSIHRPGWCDASYLNRRVLR